MQHSEHPASDLAAGDALPKPILCLDFDGVLHAYTSGWRGAAVIPDPPVPGAFDFLRAALRLFTVAVYSSRSQQPGGIPAMQAWLAGWARRELPAEADLSFLDEIIWPTEKPAAFLTLDDRAVTFTGQWPSPESLRAFRPWHQQPPARPSNSEPTD
jgi:hypothetical protein